MSIGHRTPTPAETFEIASVADRVLEGEDFHFAVREFIDSFQYTADDDRKREAALMREPPLMEDERLNAYLGALAEYLASRHGLTFPAWVTDESRFLDRFWFVSKNPGFRAISIAQAPISFKRRGVMIPERSLQRV